ncbi:hypothetical protein OHA99_25170 [Streptomyces coelicoflavus]|uniref:hypothetical protein n=1 Tax=Streptomyces TaxID=1883 RepID=UPI001290CC3A|nr:MULTISPECIES: hypothetical protein [Streptomyces]MCX5037921.1 hypothetical protein [Streptomyces coelicoflavus]QFX84014.1 hypothetical protein GEV49_26315 [Streptomyces sp. SYP-A7193]
MRPSTASEADRTWSVPKKISTVYDELGWLGKAYASPRFTGSGDCIASVVQSMENFYRPLKTAYSIPKSEGVLGVYTFTTTYNRDGTVRGVGMPAACPRRPSTLATTSCSAQQLELSTGTGKKVWETFSYEKGTRRNAKYQPGCTLPLPLGSDPAE